MPLDKETLRKLSPEERLRKLKELEEERKQDVDEIESLIKRSIEELKVDELAERIRPQEQPETLTSIVAQAEEEGIAQRQDESRIEPDSVDYQMMGQVYSSYNSLRRVLNYELAPGSLSEEQSQALDRLGDHLDTVQYTTTQEQVADMASTSKELIGRIKRYAGLQGRNLGP